MQTSWSRPPPRGLPVRRRTNETVYSALFTAITPSPLYHGYELIQSLAEFGFNESEADPGTVYRNLRRMEEEGLVSSQWDTSGGGPARRLYRLTPEGEELLHAWADAITRNKKRLENFLDKYRQEFSQK